MSAPWTTPADVRETARKKLGAWLAGLIANDEFAPFRIPVRGPGAADLGARFDEVRRWAGEWERASRGPLRLEYKKVGGRTFGVNEIPSAAWLDSYGQVWELLGARAQARCLADLAEQTRASFPSLLPWLARRPLKALDLAAEWIQLLAIVGWIGSRDTSGLYLRQVDVPGVDTKFIGQHRGVLTELLDLQLPPERVNAAGEGFEDRYGFLRKPGYVRFRCCSRIAGFSEMAVRADELTAPPTGTSRVFIVENEITYLAFPLPADAIVILGGGYAVGLLEPLTWLAGPSIVYWGDIDTHGFAILDRLRRRFPHVKSMLMDRTTLLAHRSQWVTEAVPTSTAVDHLTPPELSLYRSLADGEFGAAVRLEQERVSFAYIARAVAATAEGEDAGSGQEV
jgi:hypothetical protein